MNEKNVKECFASTMKNIGISDSFYSLEGYKEGASCIIKQNNRWLVFDAERAERYKVKEFKNIQQACLEVIRRFTYSEEDYVYLSGEFRHNLSEVVKLEANADTIRSVESIMPSKRVPFGVTKIAGRRRAVYKAALEHQAIARTGGRRLTAKEMNKKRNNSVVRKKKRGI
ncbi:MAG: hypothetical protein NC081_03740 [Roseburia sp.]|nr:hypothetical protein [Roseburia sp.]